MAIIDKIQLSGTVYTIGNETTTAVTSASTDNEIPTAKAVYDAIPKGGGGKAIEAGRGISITTGETADTVSFDLPISAITGTDIMYGGANNSVSVTNGISNYNNFFGSGNTISVSGLTKTSAMYNIVLGNENSVNFKGAEESWQYSLIIGQNNSVSYSTYMGKASAYNIICGINNTIDNNISNCFVIGNYNKPKKKFNTNIGNSLNTTNDYEFALATCNVSSSATTSFGNSGNTLFSVGNGTSSERHNAFEIRQNGDIYIADTNDTSTTNYYEKPMIKLQDALGGGGGSDINVVQTTGTSTADVMSQDAVTTQLNGKGDAIGIDMVGSPKKKVTFQMRRGGVNGTVISSRDLTLGRGLVYGEEGFDTLSTSGLVETSAITTSVTSSSTDSQVPSAKAVYDQLDGLKLKKITQSEYDALSPNYDANTLYVING